VAGRASGSCKERVQNSCTIRIAKLQLQASHKFKAGANISAATIAKPIAHGAMELECLILKLRRLDIPSKILRVVLS